MQGQESMHCSSVLASRKLASNYSMHEIASMGKENTGNENITAGPSEEGEGIKSVFCYDLVDLSLFSHYIFSCLHSQSMPKWRESIGINMFVLQS